MLDLLIKDGLVVDGTGEKARRADLAVQGDRIVEIGGIDETPAQEVLDAGGKAVCPGFINIHSHDDLYVPQDNYLELFEPYLLQGITTTVISNCGWSPAPWSPESGDILKGLLISMGVSKKLEPEWETQEEFNEYVAKRGLPMNMMPLVAHGPIRIAVMGENNRFSSDDELERMKELVREGMETGCWGFSTGLTYFPGMYAHTDEIVELARLAGEQGGRYVSHVRGHSNAYHLAVEEALDIGRRSRCAVQLSHVFCVPYLGHLVTPFYYSVGMFEAINRVIPLPGWPNPILKKAIKIVDEHLAQGEDIGMDFIPYVLGNTTVTQLFPPWANMGGTARLVERLKDPATRSRIRHDVETVKPGWPNWEEGAWSDNFLKAIGWRMLKILSVASEKNSYLEGKKVIDLAKDAGKDPFDFLADLTVEEEGSVAILFGLPPRPWTEKVFTRIHDHPQLSIGADVVFAEYGSPPPSAYGCFPRIMGHYVRELGMYTMEEAVFRCTGLAASRFGLEDRGRLAKGTYADIVIFDPHTVADMATMEKPTLHPEGIHHVFVNGQCTVKEGKSVPGVLSGRLVLRS